MATSALLVEIVVMGILTLIALCFDLNNVCPTRAHQLHEFVRDLHVGSATGAAIIFGLAFPIKVLRRPKLGWSFIKLFCKEFYIRLTSVDKSPDAVKFIGFLGNYNPAHATTMQKASSFSERLMVEHFSMLRTDRATFFIAFLFIPSSLPFLNNSLWWATALINLFAIVILYYLTKKAYIYYKLLRDQIHKVISEESRWQRELAKDVRDGDGI